MNYNMSEEAIRDSAIRRLVNKVKIRKSKTPEQIFLGGSLGREGEGFIDMKDSILADLEQAMFIKRFISKSVQSIYEQFEGKEDEMLNEFCRDEKIFKELEQSNQLDIKGRLTRLLEQFPEGFPLLSETQFTRPFTREDLIRLFVETLSFGKKKLFRMQKRFSCVQNGIHFPIQNKKHDSQFGTDRLAEA